MYDLHSVRDWACSYGKKFSRLARKHFDKFTSEISPSYENSMKSTLRSYETKSFPVNRDLTRACSYGQKLSRFPRKHFDRANSVVLFI